MFHPDDPLFARFRHSVESEQGTLARRVKPRAQSTLPGWLLDQLAETEREGGIVPLQSNALGLRYGLLRPGPDYVLHRTGQEAAQTEMLDPPSVLERRLRQRIGEMVAQQAVEDEGAAQAPRGEGLYHRYNAILKRQTGNKPRAQMTPVGPGSRGQLAGTQPPGRLCRGAEGRPALRLDRAATPELGAARRPCRRQTAGWTADASAAAAQPAAAG